MNDLLKKRIKDLLIPYMEDVEQRKYLISSIFRNSYGEIYSSIDRPGASAHFTERLVTVLDQCGKLESGEPALCYLIRMLLPFEYVGLEDQRKIFRLYVELESSTDNKNSFPKGEARYPLHTEGVLAPDETESFTSDNRKPSFLHISQLILAAIILALLFTDVETRIFSWFSTFTSHSPQVTDVSSDITLITESKTADSLEATLTALPTAISTNIPIATPAPTSASIPTITLTPATANTITCSGDSCGQNILRNGDFEQNLQFWGGTTNAEIVPGRTGKGAQVINYDGSKYSNIRQKLPGIFEQGRWYWAETWCKAEVNDKCKIFLGDTNASEEFGDPYQNQALKTIEGDGKWQRFGVSLYLNQKEQLDLYVYNEDLGSSVVYDDIRVEEIFCDANHICNGDFEKDITGWDFGPGSQVVSPDENESAMLSIQERSASDRAAWEGITQTIEISPSLTYMFGGYVDAGNAIEPHIKVEWLDSEKNFLYYNKIIGSISEAGSWSLWGQRLKTPVNARFARVFAWHGVANRKNATGSTLRVDDLFFQPYHTLCPANQLCNPSFEIDLTFGWWDEGENFIDSDAYHGQLSLKSVQRPSTDRLFWAGPSQYVEVSANQDYDVSFWLKWDAASEVHAKVLWYNAEGVDISSTNFYKAPLEYSDGWIRGGKTLRSPADAVVAQISILHGVKGGQNDTGSTLWVDNVTFRLQE